jgi:glycosyltransferase involved in cell wall biosynthesis
LTNPFLSIIIPAYNEETRLPTSLEKLYAFLDPQPYTFEVLVVENGSQDRTLKVGQEYASRLPNLRIFHMDKKGKGLAIRQGISETNGQFRFIADADFSMPVEDINLFLPPICDVDIAIGSRETPGSVRYDEPLFRHFTGRVFNLLIRLLVLPGLHDTQCGFKCFRGGVAEEIFRYQTLNGWAFDVEVLKIARLHGLQIKEIPVHWSYFPGSKVSILRDSIHMLNELLIIRRNAQRGDYDRKV